MMTTTANKLEQNSPQQQQYQGGGREAMMMLMMRTMRQDGRDGISHAILNNTYHTTINHTHTHTQYKTERGTGRDGTSHYNMWCRIDSLSCRTGSFPLSLFVGFDPFLVLLLPPLSTVSIDLCSILFRFLLFSVRPYQYIRLFIVSHRIYSSLLRGIPILFFFFFVLLLLLLLSSLFGSWNCYAIDPNAPLSQAERRSTRYPSLL